MEAYNDNETQNGTEFAERPNDVTIFYALSGALGSKISEFEELQDAAVGARVTGQGSSGSNFEEGWWTGSEDGRVTVSRKFTIGMDVPAWKVQAMVDELESVAGGRGSVEIRVSGSVPGLPPKYTSAGNVIPGGPAKTEYSEDEVDHTGVVTATVDVTDFMAGAN